MGRALLIDLRFICEKYSKIRSLQSDSNKTNSSQFIFTVPDLQEILVTISAERGVHKQQTDKTKTALIIFVFYLIIVRERAEMKQFVAAKWKLAATPDEQHGAGTKAEVE